jgi:hypothetical protein
MPVFSSRFLAFCVSSVAAMASANSIYLGSVLLNDSEESDLLHLPACASSFNARVHSLQLEVRRSSADIEKLQVQYQNGDVDLLSVRETFAEGAKSRWIDLSGNDRCIRFIRVVGDSNGGPQQKAQVLFYGKN